MTDKERNKLAAAAKMALGVVRISSGIATGPGHGMIGGALRQHHMMRSAMTLGRQGILSGKRQIDEGHAEWKRINANPKGTSSC